MLVEAAAAHKGGSPKLGCDGECRVTQATARMQGHQSVDAVQVRKAARAVATVRLPSSASRRVVLQERTSIAAREVRIAQPSRGCSTSRRCDRGFVGINAKDDALRHRRRQESGGL